MGFVSQVAISYKESAFSDLPSPKRKVAKFIIGRGNSYNNILTNTDFYFIKCIFENKPNQIIKTLSHTKPFYAKSFKIFVNMMKAFINKDDYELSENLNVEFLNFTKEELKELNCYFNSIQKNIKRKS